MSYIHITPESNLGSKELNKMLSFIQKEGYERLFDHQTINFGIVRNSRLDPNFDYFKITYPGTGNIVNIQEGFAYCKVLDQIRLIYCKAQSISIPLLEDKFWIKIAPKYNNLEKGTLSISSNGSVVGINTEFLSVLRGQPNLPSKIRLIGSVGNTQEYEVLEVISDTSIILVGTSNISFVAENNLQYEIIGTFTRGYQEPLEDKGIFVYDGCIEFINVNDMGIVRETLSPNVGEIVYPELTPFQINEAFLIYQITSDGTNIVSVRDHRDNRIESIAEETMSRLDIIPNKIFGIDKVSWDSLLHPKHTNIVQVAWGLRAVISGQPLPLQPYSLIINAGNIWGGRIKKNSVSANVGDILSNANDLLGWRVYVKNTFNQYGANHIKQAYARIIASTTTNSSLTITLDHISIFDFENTIFDAEDQYDIGVRTFSGLDNFISYKQGNNIDPGSVAPYNNLTTYIVGATAITIEGYIWEALFVTAGDAPLIESETSNRVVSYENISYPINKLVFYNNVVYKTLSITSVGSIPDNVPSEFRPIWTLIWKRENQEIFIVPDCEQIEILSCLGKDVEHNKIIVNNDPSNFAAKITSKNSFDKLSLFNIADQFGIIDLLAFNDVIDINGGWNLKYRYKNNHTYSDWIIPYSDSIGYLKEARINEDYQNSSNYSNPYITSKELGWLKLIKHPNNYESVINRLDLGDKPGVRQREITGDIDNYIGLTSGIDEQWQLFKGATFSLSDDIIINLEGIREGNRFYIQINQPINLNGHNIIIKTGATVLSPTTTGEIIKTITGPEASSFVRDQGLLIIFNYDEEQLTSQKWVYWNQIINDLGDKYKTSSITTSFTPISALNSTKTFPTPQGMSYSSGVRLRATSIEDPNDWVEGICSSYAGNSVLIYIDVTSGSTVGITDWLINIGGSNSFIMNNKIYASAATITSEFAGSTTATIWESTGFSVGTADFDSINLHIGQAYFALRLESVVSDLAATCFDTISYGEKPNTNLLPQVSGKPRFGYFKAPKTANYKCKFSCSILPNISGPGSTSITFYIRKSPQIPVSPEINVAQTVQRTLSDSDDLTLINLTTDEVIVSLNQDDILQLTYLLTEFNDISTNIASIKLGRASFIIEEV